MALTNNNLEIIKAIANNNIHSAKKAALASLMEDTSKKNASIVNYYKKLLTSNSSILMTNLPSDMKTILVGAVPGEFAVERYYLRESEQLIVDNIIKMKLVSDEMSSRRIPYKNTTLLYGDSGTGKTELGKYIAYKLNLPFFYISFVSTIDSYMGSTAKNIHKIFEFCNSIPCVLMLDEIDCIATKRSTGGRNGPDGEIERTTISLMQELDKLPNHVTLIAATNRIDIVDDAILRRFSVRHEIKNMSVPELRAMIDQYLLATDTKKYIDEEDIMKLTNTYHNPGQILPELIKIIGNGIYNEKKDSFSIEDDIVANDLNLWEVTYTWKTNITADTEEDAIAIGRRERSNYSCKGCVEDYSAKKADFITNVK